VVDFSVSPYFDDFSEQAKFLKILFRPGYAVQARELNQAQTILQNQISRFGNHIFKDGAMVIPGNIGHDLVDYVKLQSVSPSGDLTTTFLSSLENTIVTGQDSGMKAIIVKSSVEESGDPNTIFVKYLNSGTNGTTTSFFDNEIIVNDSEFQLSVISAVSSSTGKGSIATIQNGIYYIKGNFIIVDKETIILEKYSTNPSFRIGLEIYESTVAPEVDDSLYDNAIGTPNQSAPGAHRYKISTHLVKLPLNSSNDSNFVELLRLDENTVQLMVTKTDYSELEKTLARRTYDESGDYVVNGFSIELKEDRNNDRGNWQANTAYIAGDIITVNSNKFVAKNNGTSGSTQPTLTSVYTNVTDGSISWQYTETPVYNNGIFLNGDETKFIAAISPGKAYVRGYELEKFNTTYVKIDKSRQFKHSNSTVIGTSIGNYVLLSSPFSIIESLGSNFPKIDLYDRIISSNGTASGTKIGEARIRWIEADDANPNAYKAFIFNIAMNIGKVFERHVKSVFFNNTTLAQDFTANIFSQTSQLSGSITSTATTISGTGTKFTTELVVGDYISFTFGGVTYTKLIESIANDYTITISTGPTVTAPVPFYLITTNIKEPNNSSLVFPLPNSYVRMIRGTDDISYSDTVYYRTKYFPRTQASGTTLTLNVDNSSTDTFAPTTSQNYTIINDNGTYSSGHTLTLNGGSTTLTISGLASNAFYTVLATVRKSGIKEKTKTLTISSPKDVTTSAEVNSNVIYLKPDTYRILSIKQAPSFGAIGVGNLATIDISNNFVFNNGQTDTHYDLAYISLLSNAPKPTGSIRVEYEYFTHSSGDYFSVDSYKNTIPYKDIPFYLRDSLDFRPRITDDGLQFTTTNIGVPKRGFFAEADYSFYLSKNTIIELDMYGTLMAADGESSISPKSPNISQNSMLMAELSIEPFTLKADNNSINIKIIDNKRYTMRDIGKLEKRIYNVEYYTSLSLLEQETKSMAIIDSNGLDRYKNGFLVDSFNGHGVGNINSIDYKCSIDSDNSVLRPMFNIENIDLIEYNQRSSSNYQVTGDFITLPYINTVLVDQPFASRVENVNPFAIFTFIGAVDMKPSSDNWFETIQAPDIIINREGDFNTLLSLGEASNAFGTSWNSWNNVWTGSPVVTGVTSRGFSGPGIRFITSQTSATQIGQARTGIRNTLVSKIDTQEIDNKIISSSVIPFMRSRNILILTRGLKPSTNFHAFFDGISIDSYITPASKISFNPVSGFGSNFDFKTNVANDSTNSARQFNGVVETALTSGDVITGLTSGATAIVALQENSNDNGKSIFIVNVKGTFQLGEIISGSISGSRGFISNVIIKSLGDELISNFNGDVCGLFAIPNDEKLKFRTGEHEFKLTTSASNGVDSSSQARANFAASGVINTNQKTIIATRNGEIIREAVAEERIITQVSSRVIADTGWYDPLAQSFLVRQKGGAFLTAVDLYFASKDSAIPVQMELREMVNGYPGKKVLPNSRVVLTPDLVNISNNITTLDSGNQYNSPDIATKFTFESPIYVTDNTEYCIVLLSDSNAYNVWISQLGDKVADSDRYISDQPYAGVLFKSQNASTWSADQYQDLTFKLYRAKFDTNVSGSIKFNNTLLPQKKLSTKSLQTLSGSQLVRIWSKNHGFTNGDKVTISGFVGTFNGIPAANLNGSFTVSNCNFDSFVITLGVNSTISGYTGSNTAYITSNVKFETIKPNISYLNFPDTSISLDIKASNVGGTLDTNYLPISFDNNTEFNSTKCVMTSENETLYNSSNKSLELVAHLSTTNDAVSPIIDMHRMSIILIGNIVDSFSSSTTSLMNDPNYISTNLDIRTIASGAVFAINNTTKRLTTSDATTQNLFKTAVIGKFVTLAGCTTTSNNGTYKIIDVDYVTGAYLTIDAASLTTESSVSGSSIKINDFYMDEIGGIGASSSCKYVTNTVTFANPCTNLNIMFAYNMPSFCDIDVYYKIIPNNSSINNDLLPYIKIAPESGLIQSDSGEYIDAKYSTDVLGGFSNIIIKIVLKSTNAAYVPTIRDFRVISCA
jgi:hypothetical protein